MSPSAAANRSRATITLNCESGRSPVRGIVQSHAKVSRFRAALDRRQNVTLPERATGGPRSTQYEVLPDGHGNPGIGGCKLRGHMANLYGLSPPLPALVSRAGKREDRATVASAIRCLGRDRRVGGGALHAQNETPQARRDRIVIRMRPFPVRGSADNSSNLANGYGRFLRQARLL